MGQRLVRLQELEEMKKTVKKMNNDQIATVEHILQAEKDSRRKSAIKRPRFLPNSGITDSMRRTQRSDPTRCAMTLEQWNDFIDFCKGTQVWEQIKKTKGCVNLYDLNKHFVIPLTQGTGCSIAVLLNKRTPMVAQIMISHSWAEDMEECQEAVNDHFHSESIPEDTAIWFCGFALYQPGDDEGPSIEKQLEKNPFIQVITSPPLQSPPGRMIAVHTTQADLWERLWCIVEVRESLAKEICIKAACSQAYSIRFEKKYSEAIKAGHAHQDGLDRSGVRVQSARAECCEKDEPMLLEMLKKHGTFAEIDKAVTDCRRNAVHRLVLKVAVKAAEEAQPDALIELAKQEDLQAVVALHELAEERDQPCHDQICTALHSIAKSFQRKHVVVHGIHDDIDFWRRREPQLRDSARLPPDSGLQLVIVLLQTMACKGHRQSLQVLAEIDSGAHGCIGERYGKWDQNNQQGWSHDSFYPRHCYPELQTLALQGSRQAVDELMQRARGKDQKARKALECLAQQWNWQVLSVLMAMGKEDAEREWADGLLKKCKTSLATW
eukprot:gnl/TRDRNA2_/TRDRNA2_169985_c4_seq4.p1 gnl/TRDRNA2_/TRDRNA2_169985_c4~~gnl/TRDRNA2_/TRDRNA2_169985_c4_seq4.p1  ORF type:complete len:550 (+),score=83.21 gnl/TRDRNA2_/TRDRNA2_169985_c4_seq4:102-1751(+)